MAEFRYKARSNRGDLLQGAVEGASVEAVAAQLLNSGITPVDIQETRSASGADIDLRALFTRRKVDLTDLLLFSRQMYSLLKAGVPIVRGMRGLAESTRNPTLSEILNDVTSELEMGRDLSSALSNYQDIFPTLMISMVRVGENTGRLDEVFLRVALYLELEKETKERIKSALRYPTFVLVALGFAIAVINLFVIPAFAKVFKQAGADLPWATQVLMSVSEFFVTYWPYMLVGLIFAVAGFRTWISTEQGRYRWDKFKLRLPIVGGIIHRATLARFARAFSLASRSGVPLIQGLTVVSRTLDNEYVGDRVQQMRNGVERGDTLTRTAAATGLFTPLVLQMMAVGEETGAIDDLLEEVAGFYEREVDHDVKNLSAAIEPILIVAVGIMVLILALGVFLPMWDLSSAVHK